MAYSFSIQPEEGGTEVDFADYGLMVEDYELPFEGEPDSYTVNVPGMVGGYTYVNEAKPAMLTLNVVVTASSHANLISYLDSIISNLVTTNKYQIYVDGVGKYWIGRRVSGIQAGLFGAGVKSARFDIVFSCEDPTSYDVVEGT
jgi:hypothetical protein